MALTYQILLAVLLDQLLGDPRWLPHPVRLIGAACSRFEKITRKILPPFGAGLTSVLLVLTATALTVHGLLLAANLIHPSLATAMSVYLLYTTIAARDLTRHSKEVYQALAKDDLPEARRRVAMIVGRDTAALDRQGVAKAAVESVAESMVDGITAPLFFAVVGGPMGAMLYKAINTMDSMFGYKNERYEKFGWGPARLDDLANFIPARLTSMLIPAAAWLLRLDAKRALYTLARDRLNHSSPNSGHSEAAVAGALGVQLGGPSIYFGRLVAKATIGDATRPIEPSDILRSNRLVLTSAALALLFLLAMRLQIFTLLDRVF
ncbi:MAG: adenosylcobinamide-phosphate synthase CbiB [Desulfobulbaceae bacterium]|nr:adenosylcobinamide-phosphate synthase CbiB [Desulfobulbaceae bacterium]HIJ78310.1 cobalamin biosynthesis protein CobD [Deltaproteobacteria bacterium]